MIGVDEVGRGSWAGPLLIVAARQTAELPLGLADSKLLTKPKREAFIEAIQQSCDLGEGWVSVKEINSLGLTKAMRLGVKRALLNLKCLPDEEVIMDGNVNYCPKKYLKAQCVIDADDTHPIVSAASIYAKVTRDNYMATISKKYPHYSFEKHVGYGTKLHQEMLKLHGACDLHRLNWRPLRELQSV